MAFQSMRNGENVDKSGLIAVVNNSLFTERRFSCVIDQIRRKETAPRQLFRSAGSAACYRKDARIRLL